jgi:hypothetical protein
LQEIDMAGYDDRGSGGGDYREGSPGNFGPPGGYDDRDRFRGDDDDRDRDRYKGGGSEFARNQVKGPAMGLLATAVIGFVVQIILIVLTFTAPTLFSGFLQNMQGQAKTQRERDQLNEAMQQLQQGPSVLDILAHVVALVVGGVILYGALKMKELESFGLAVTASVLAMLPWISPCCCIGLPMGIWSLVVLLNERVKSEFH